MLLCKIEIAQNYLKYKKEKNMISFLRGIVEAKETESVIINVNGVGYLVNVPSTEKFTLSQKEQTIFTYLYVREDRLVLYGFLEKNHRDFFKLLIDTPGIGPRVALNIITDINPNEFYRAVLEEDLSIISSITGIGNKLARKIVLELKEKLKKFTFLNNLVEESYREDVIYDGIEALKSLGYPEKEAKQMIVMASKKLKNNKNPLIVETLIKYALNKEKM